jgi:opacity protein-like surface antigen
MKKLVLVMMLLLSFSVMAAAQDAPALEVFGGYSFLRCDTGSDDIACNLSGWSGSAAINANRYIGGLIEFSGNYGTVNEETLRIHSLLVGPRFTYRMEKVTPFAQMLLGVVRENAADSLTNRFGMTFGGGIDVNITDRIAIRPVQAEYYTIKVQNEFTKNFRYSAGVVIKLGDRF